MKKYLLLFSIPFLILISLLVLSFAKISELESKEVDIINIKNDLSYVSNELEIEKLFTNDLNLANDELKQWIIRGNTQSKFWSEFINKEINTAYSHSPKSSSSVNTEVNKLLSYLSRTFDSRKVKLGTSKPSEASFLIPDAENKIKFGYGFSAYDGFWPSFDKEEANTILIQAKIVKEICEFLLGSFDIGETFALLSIKREAAGPEDKKHIGDSVYIKPNQTTCLRDSKLVSSHVFEISFTGKTRNCRTFINQLRAPYSLRSMQVTRQEINEAESQSGFSKSANAEESGILPIIRDISSKFTLEIEYVYKTNSTLHELASQVLPVDLDAEKAEEILNLFN